VGPGEKKPEEIKPVAKESGWLWIAWYFVLRILDTTAILRCIKCIGNSLNAPEPVSGYSEVYCN
jgi:hypothetical protein